MHPFRFPRSTHSRPAASARRGSLLLAALAASALLAAPIFAADCPTGRDSPLASSLYRGHVQIIGCDGSGDYPVAVKARIVTTVRRFDDIVVSRSEKIVTLDEVVTNIGGDAFPEFDWCDDIAPHVPSFLPRGTTVDATIFAEVSLPGSSVPVWTSPDRPLDQNNFPIFGEDLRGEAVCTAEAPVVTIERPTDRSVFAGVDCPFGNCATPITFAVEASASARVLEMPYEVFTESGDLHDTGFLCRYDPIEPTHCSTSRAPYTASIEHAIGLEEGTWTVVVHAQDAYGRVGSDEVEVTVLPGNTDYPGPISVDFVDPLRGNGRVQLRGGTSPLSLQGTRLSVYGENLHEDVRVFISPYNLEVSSADWLLYECDNVTVGQDGGRLQFNLPELPERTPINNRPGAAVVDVTRIRWRILIRDDYLRPGRIFETAIPGFLDEHPAEAYLQIVEPEYPYLHGLGFQNEAPNGSLDQFLAVYGDNAYVCGGVNIDGECRGVLLFPDPIYLGIWYPIFETWMWGATGSCVGMAATSRLMADGDIDPRDIDPDVYFAAGFEVRDASDEWYEGPGANFLGPPSPRNTWAHVLRNHGVQTSAEFWREWAHDLSLISWGGDPVARLSELNQPGSSELICMMRAVNGHCVTPYGVEPATGGVWDVQIYDNNDPRTPLVIEIDPSNNTYDMVHDDRYQGTALTTIPKSVWTSPRTMPGLGDLAEIIVLVIGEADPVVEADGGTWTISETGEVESDIPGAVWAPPFNGAPQADGATPLLLPASTTDARVTLRAKGGDAIFHSSKGRNFLQLHVEDSPAEVDHEVFVETTDEDGAGYAFRPGARGLVCEPRVAMALSDSERAVFAWSGLAVEEDAEYAFRTRPSLRGVEYDNDSRRATSHELLLYAADGASESNSLVRFGPFEVPAGARHRTRVVDWPVMGTILSELDLDRDGEFDESEEVAGSTCGSPRDLLDAGASRRLGEICGGADGLFRRGDADQSGAVDITDAIYGLDHLFLGGPAPGCLDAADANDDGSQDLSDSVLILAVLFLGEGALPSPGTEACGADPSADTLDCAVTGGACP